MSGPISEPWDAREPFGQKPGPCHVCGRDPADGWARITVDGEPRWFCYDQGELDCYWVHKLDRIDHPDTK